MTPSDTPPTGNETSSSLQRVGIAIGTLIIVILTVVAALFLAMQDLAEDTTPVAGQVSPTSIPVVATVPPTPTPSPTARIVPTGTPSATPTSPPAVEPTRTHTPLPTGTFTKTPAPPSPTPAHTSTRVVVVVTPTPPPAPPATVPPAGGACQPPPSWEAYTVQPGDTLNTLATRTGTSVFELQQFNCLESFTIQSGQIVYLPFIPPTPTVTPTPRPTDRPGPTPTRSPTPINPQIDSVTPNRVDKETAEQPILISVLGRNFQSSAAGFRVELTGAASTQLQLGDVRTSTSFQAIVPPNLPDGTYALVVVNPSGRIGTRQSAFTIGPPGPTDTPSPAPDIIRFTPTSGRISEEIILTAQGRNFQSNDPGFKVELQAIGGSLRVELDLGDTRTNTNFEAIIRAGALDVGNYSLIVTNPDGRSDIAADQYRAIE